MTVEINIYLHGYFFAEIQEDQQRLVVASPPYDMHKFGYWDDQERTWHRFPSSPFDWIKALQDGGKQSFPKDILQFSRDDLGLTRSFIQPPDSGRQYEVYMELPLPSGITSARDGGDMAELHMKNCKVKKSVGGHCGSNARLSLITCLTYEASGIVGFRDINFYAEHCMEPGVGDLNDLFKKTREVLPEFDLELEKLRGASTDNEKTLCELGSALKNNPCGSCNTPMHLLLLRTANCPQFGVVQT